MPKCSCCKEKIENPAYINGKEVCQVCFLKLRDGKRIYKIEHLRIKITPETLNEIHKLRGRISDKGHSDNLLEYEQNE